MKKVFALAFITLLAACSPKQSTDFIITVSNDQAFDREELVEVPISDISKQVRLVDEEQYIVLDAKGDQVPYQITYDDNLLFPVTIKAGAEAVYTISVGRPIKVESSVYGRHYPERLDDIAWENDRIAFRTFGPALQHKGERDFGYDVWVKRVPELVIEQRYATALSPYTQDEIARLRKARKHAEANELYNTISYNVDHGNGLDCYKVGATLGCGTAALMQGDDLIYPYCWKEHEVLENGPLRFTVKLTYNPITVGKEQVVETRIISLEKGSQLNKTIVSYAGLTKTTPIATGLAIHPQHPNAYVLEADKGYIAYSDLTDNANNGNGVIYVGAVMPQNVKKATTIAFSDKEAKERSALGHALAISNYRPGTNYTYYWGASWSKYGFILMEEWTQYLDLYAQRVRHPLSIVY